MYKLLQIVPGLALTLALSLAVSGCQRKTDPPAGVPEAPAAASPGGVAAATDAAGYTAPPLNAGPPRDGPATLEFGGPVGAGAEFLVRWTGPANPGDYIDIVPRGSTLTSGEIAYGYVRDTKPAGVTVRAPGTAGDYDLRYVVDLDGGRKTAAVIPLSIAAATATLTAPAEVAGGKDIQVAWTGPNGDGDYIDIVPAGTAQTSGEISYAYTRDGASVTLKAPGPSGSYEVRYVMEGPDGRRVLARVPLAVTLPTATLELKAVAVRGEILAVAWTGPDNQGDYVDVVPAGYGQTSGELAYFYTRDGSPGGMNAPAAAGDYEVRYVMEAPKGRLPLKVE